MDDFLLQFPKTFTPTINNKVDRLRHFCLNPQQLKTKELSFFFTDNYSFNK